jgi:hypothetical protein
MYFEDDFNLCFYRNKYGMDIYLRKDKLNPVEQMKGVLLLAIANHNGCVTFFVCNRKVEYDQKG